MKKSTENLIFFGIPIFILLLVITLFLCRTPRYAKDKEAMKEVYAMVEKGDYKGALPIVSKLARLDNCDAQFFLYKIYSEGKHAPKDMETALRWLRQAAGYDHPAAQYHWGMHLLDKDPARAEFYLRSARKAGYKE